jgi:coenzyme F420-dependent glucose-6-phosphate dehydrogenase
VWGAIGGVAQATERLRVGTGVTCPIMRIHPGIIAQAAATAEEMMPGRFFLGVGSGENLNEHIFGEAWPEPAVRLEMLEEAIEVIRLLWKGGTQSHRGRYFTVDNACIYTLPEKPPPIMIAASGEQAASLAGRVGDGLVSTAPEPEMLKAFDKAGGKGKPRYGQLTVCWDENEKEARRVAHEWWPNTAIPGVLFTEIKQPEHFEQLAKNIREEDVADKLPCGPDPKAHIDAIREYADAGYDHVYVHQIGPKQEEAISFYEREVLPRFAPRRERAAS